MSDQLAMFGAPTPGNEIRGTETFSGTREALGALDASDALIYDATEDPPPDRVNALLDESKELLAIAISTFIHEMTASAMDRTTVSNLDRDWLAHPHGMGYMRRMANLALEQS